MFLKCNKTGFFLLNSLLILLTFVSVCVCGEGGGGGVYESKRLVGGRKGGVGLHWLEDNSTAHVFHLLFRSNNRASR
jgi:hypothetical protein